MKRRKRRSRNKPLYGIIAALSVLLVVLIIIAANGNRPEGDASLSTPNTGSGESTGSTPPPSSVVTEPTPHKESSATISAVGDVLMHDSVLNSGYSGGEYSFDSIFSYFMDYVNRSDYAVANLETTLAGSDNGYSYKGYPNFNCPDTILPALKNSGFDMILTANNHSYDTKSVGFRRTAKTVTTYGLDRLGTKETADEPDYVLRQINGINIGMMCYTYETGGVAEEVHLNGKELAAWDAPLVNSFDYSHMDLFYTEIRENMAALQEQGADAVILFIHWGTEYQTKQNKTQSSIAQKLCDLGIDVIVGGHPHVVQPVDLLTSTTDENHKTVCIYSLGNFISNQRRNLMRLDTGHTEDGIMFSITFAKYSDGTVIMEKADILPFWVDMQKIGDRKIYHVLPLDTQIEDWQTQFSLSDATLQDAKNSYKRTTDIVGAGLEKVNAYLQTLVQQTEQRLNIQ